MQDFDSKLCNHLLARLRNLDSNDDEIVFTHKDRFSLDIEDEKIYEQKTCRFNFTTYDMRRAQDTIKSGSHRRDVMLHARDDPNSPRYHPYWYARVLKLNSFLFLTSIDGPFFEVFLA